MKLILSFVADYHKYFGKVFNYEGTDYVEVARRESREICEAIELIRLEEDPTIWKNVYNHLIILICIK